VSEGLEQPVSLPWWHGTQPGLQSSSYSITWASHRHFGSRDTATELGLLHLGFSYCLQYRPPSSPRVLASRVISIIASLQGESRCFPFLLTSVLLLTLPSKGGKAVVRWIWSCCRSRTQPRASRSLPACRPALRLTPASTTTVPDSSSAFGWRVRKSLTCAGSLAPDKPRLQLQLFAQQSY